MKSALAPFFLFALLAMAVVGPEFVAPSASDFHLDQRFASPSVEALFGRDQFGVDVFSQIVVGARVSIGISITVVVISVLIGTMVGSIAGYFRGWTDLLLSRLIEMLQAFPGFLLALSFVALLGPSLKNLIIAMCLSGWTGYARLVRGEVLHLKERDFTLSAQALGATPTRILLKHILPNLMGALLVQATLGFAGVILAESGLSFLGLGAADDAPSWGALLNSGRRFLFEAPHLSFFPGLAIFAFVFSLQSSAGHLRRALGRER